MGHKGFLKSKTIQGVIVFIAGFAMSKGWIPALDASAFASDIVTLIGSVYAIYGRLSTKGEKLKIK